MDVESEQAAAGRTPLIDSLVADLVPVRPVRLARMYVLTLCAQLLFVATAALFVGASSPALAKTSAVFFGALVALLAAGAFAAAVAAMRLSIPGRHVSDAYTLAVLCVPLLLSAAVVVAALWGAEWTGFAAHVGGGMPCTTETVKLAVPAWIVSLLLLRTLAPLSPLRVGILATVSASLLGAVVVQLSCANGDAYHLAISHYLPVVVAGLAGGGVAGLLFRMGEARVSPGDG